MNAYTTETTEKVVTELREELRALRERTALLEQRVSRLEVREKMLESPEAAGDPAQGYR